MKHNTTTSQPQMIIVTSSNGTIKAHARSGIVTEINDESEDQCISNIKQFNIPEFRGHYNIETVEDMPDHIDILDLGYWGTDETGASFYAEPEADWRAEFRTTDFFTDNPSPTKFVQSQHPQPASQKQPATTFTSRITFYPELIDPNSQFDAIEIHPLANVSMEPGENLPAIVDEEDAQYYGVYIHLSEAAGIECIADCSTKEAAEQLATILELAGKLYYRNPEAE